MLTVQRTGLILRPNSRRVLIRTFLPGSEQRIRAIIARVLTVSEDEVDQEWMRVLIDFGNRHPHIANFFLKRFEEVRPYLPTDIPLSAGRQCLLGAYFTQEYALEAAALFNPSMVWHPDQEGLADGEKRFILSLRATGEGHISSIVFRSGIVGADGSIRIDTPSPFVTAADVLPDSRYNKSLFNRKLQELDLLNRFAEETLALLPEEFTDNDLKETLAFQERRNRVMARENNRTAQGLMVLALANYEFCYAPDQALSERVVFPYSPTESGGIEDARFVRFVEDDGSIRYYATYTAYDGRIALPQFLETQDFLHFRISTLNGSEIQNKGMALFPRKIGGHYVMLSRQDNENIYIMYSDMVHFWHEKKLLLRPTYPWEYVQLGNCGSPIETDAGWLVIHHGVGPMRRYSIGAFLLDKDDPERAIGRLPEPLLAPDEEEREGYVPNVVYSCGGQVHNGILILPYAMSDSASSFATIRLDELLGAMKPV
jgi:predicted GH43/DUF377 family glycosyl hydrolase